MTSPEDRFSALFDSTHVALLGYAVRRVTDPTDAADVVAETYLLALAPPRRRPAGYRGAKKQIATQCLTLAEAEAEAEAVARRLVGDQGSVSRVRDDTASCTRVDMEVGGSITVTLHGPTTAQP